MTCKGRIRRKKKNLPCRYRRGRISKAPDGRAMAGDPLSDQRENSSRNSSIFFGRGSAAKATISLIRALWAG